MYYVSIYVRILNLSILDEKRTLNKNLLQMENLKILFAHIDGSSFFFYKCVILIPLTMAALALLVDT